MQKLKLRGQSNRIVCLLLIFVMTISIAFRPAPVSAGTYSGTCGKNLIWSLDSMTGVLVIDGTGDMNDYSSQDGRGSPWYNYRETILQVRIYSGVTSIGDHAFYRCSSMTSVAIPESITSIGEYAFRVCESLTSITIPKSVTSIGKMALSYCTSLTSITIPEGVTSIGDQMFANCSSLISINIPESVTSIDDFAFVYCSSLTSITIPEGVTSINYGTFSGCSSLATITIPEGVTSISRSAFSGCSSLTSINIPEGVTTIGNEAFQRCSSLTSITIPEGIDFIGSSIFSDCTSLKNVYFRGPIPSFWGAWAFSNNAAGRKLYYNTYHQDSWSPNGETSRYTYPIAPMSPITDFLLDSPMQLGMGLQNKIAITTVPEHASQDPFTYLSHNPNIASVDNEGLITGKAVGTTYIAVTEPALNATKLLTVHVVDPVSSIVISGGKSSIDYEESFQLTVTVFPLNASQDVKWLSTNPSVAEVDQAGLVVGIGGGSTYIVAKAVDGSKKSESFLLEVIRHPESIVLDKTEIDVYTANPVQLTATVLPEETSNKNVWWSSSDESIAVVENGLVTAIDNGAALITATTENGNVSASCRVHSFVNVEKVTLNKSDLWLAVNGKEALVATILPVNAWNNNLQWSSSDPEVVTVEDGEVTGQREGTAAIVVRSEEGGLSAMCMVTVYPEGTYPPFSDVQPSAWYYTYVDILRQLGVVSGFGDTNEFRPTLTVKREEAAKMIVESVGLEHRDLIADFDDVSPQSWATGYIAALVMQGAVSGYQGTNEFRPKNHVLRSHASKMVVRAFDLKMGSIPVNFPDLPVDITLSEPIVILASNGVVKGNPKTGQFNPNDEMTRAEFVKVIVISMTVAGVEEAESFKTREAVDAAQELIDRLPLDQDLETRAYLQGRLDAIELVG